MPLHTIPYPCSNLCSVQIIFTAVQIIFTAVHYRPERCKVLLCSVAHNRKALCVWYRDQCNVWCRTLCVAHNRDVCVVQRAKCGAEPYVWRIIGMPIVCRTVIFSIPAVQNVWGDSAESGGDFMTEQVQVHWIHCTAISANTIVWPTPTPLTDTELQVNMAFYSLAIRNWRYNAGDIL